MRKGNRDLQETATLGKALLLLDRAKLADEVIDFLAGRRAQDVPNLHKRVRERINDRAANRQGDIAQQALANGILPVRSIGALDDLVVLEGNNAGQLDAGLRVPGEVALLRELELGRTAKARLRGRRVELDGLQSKRAVTVMQKAPEGRLRLLRLVIRQKLVRVALVANLGENGIVRRATHFEFFWTWMSSWTKFNARQFFALGQTNATRIQLKQTIMGDFAFDEVPPC